jgi:hypothetical protein
VPIILNDSEIKRLLGSVIVNGDGANIRPNAYVLRLGAKGEFLIFGFRSRTTENQAMSEFLKANGVFVGLALIIISAIVLFFTSRRK